MFARRPDAPVPLRRTRRIQPLELAAHVVQGSTTRCLSAAETTRLADLLARRWSLTEVAHRTVGPTDTVFAVPDPRDAGLPDAVRDARVAGDLPVRVFAVRVEL
jgi:hypothetical protein